MKEGWKIIANSDEREVFHGDFVGFETKLIFKAFFSNGI